MRTLSEMIAAAIAKPIVVPIVASVAGAMGLPGIANAALSGTGLSSLGGIGSSISGFLGTSLFGAGAGLPESAALEGALVGMAPGATAAQFTLGSALGYGAAGMMGYGALGGYLGLPQGGYSNIGSGLGAAGGAAGGAAVLGASIGTTMGPIVGTAIGATVGGVLGSFLGGSESKAKFQVAAGSATSRPVVQTAFGPLGYGTTNKMSENEKPARTRIRVHQGRHRPHRILPCPNQ